MDHPLITPKNKELRGRVVTLLKDGFTVRRDSNLVFVCGGNTPRCLRKRFQRYMAKNGEEFEYFEPEFAMENYFKSGDEEPFDIGDFEQIVGRLSHSIVVFPEGPGSFAELGYFSMIPDLLGRTVLVIDSNRQKRDSFILLGPASKVDKDSKFRSTIYNSKNNPEFDTVISRLRQRKPLSARKKSLSYGKFSEFSDYDLFALVFEIVRILKAATQSDIIYVLNALFKGSVGASRVLKVISILVGSERLEEFSSLGHLKIGRNVSRLFFVKEGYKETELEVNVELASLHKAHSRDIKDVDG